MEDRKYIVPASMAKIVEGAGYIPAVQTGNLLFVVGQVGRTPDLQVIDDPKVQFEAVWRNLAEVLSAAGCGFEDVIEMTSYHVDMTKHMDVFRDVKNACFPRRLCAWTRIGVSELAHPGLLVEVKCIAVVP